MRIAICMPAPAEREQLNRWVSQYCTLYGTLPEITDMARKEGLETGQYSIAFVGIGGPDGFLAARQLRDRDRACKIILIDDTKEFAVRGVRIHCTDFILRPVEFRHIVRAMRLAGVGT